MAGRSEFSTLWRPRALAVVLAMTALLVGFSTAAQAHDVLVGTTPADGSTTAVAPALVRLTLSQPALAVGTVVIVTGPSGPVQTGKAVLVGRTITQRLRPDSPAGRYTVVWRATSSDGHPVSGKLSFTATAASAGKHATSTTTSTTSTTEPAPQGATPSTVAAAALPAAATGTSTPAGAGGMATSWWVVTVGIVLALLTTAFLVVRRLRSTRSSNLGPRS